jgi:pimeloyl-ACP methyl ester carboxylesterase
MAAHTGTVDAPDGTRVYFEVEGQGPPLVLTNGLTTTRFFWKYLRPRWRERFTLLTWELPGHGESSPAASDRSASIEGLPPILARVMDAAGIARATQVGWSVGCQVVFELYRQLPERCSALVSLFGPAGHALRNTALPVSGSLLYAALRSAQGASFAALVMRLSKLVELPFGPQLLKQSGVVGVGTSDQDVRALVRDLQRIDPSTGARMACSAERHTAIGVLTRLHVPLLIMAGDKDRFAPAQRVGLPLHRAALGSTFVRLRQGTHTALLDHADEIASAVEAFAPGSSARA